MESSDVEVIIYDLIDPITNELRYVGRTINKLHKRLNGHISKARHNETKTHKDRWILKLLESNNKPIIRERDRIVGWTESYKKEQQIINNLVQNKVNLTNLHDRGEGGLQRNFSKEQREKISKSVKKRHEEGLCTSGRKKVDLYDLKGNFINTFDSYRKCAEFIGVKIKNFECSMQRNAKRIYTFQAKPHGSPRPGEWKQRTGEIAKNFRPLYLYDTIEDKTLYFDSRKSFLKEFNLVGTSLINYYLEKDKLFRNRYKITNKL